MPSTKPATWAQTATLPGAAARVIDAMPVKNCPKNHRASIKTAGMSRVQRKNNTGTSTVTHAVGKETR